MTWTTMGAAALATAIALSPAKAQDGHSQPAGGPYAPRLGDLMILQQIRHAKLWFAVAANNWLLADHELAGLKDGFDDLATLYSTVHDVTVAPVIEAISNRELADLGKAIGAQDRVKFVSAFDQLTSACNACHQATQHGFIVIQQPISPPFNNQSFVPGGQSAPTAAPHPH